MSVDAIQTATDQLVELFAARVQRLRETLKTTHPELPLVLRRGAHPKHHGIVRALFAVRPDIEPALRHGLFAHPRTYPAYVRFSNAGNGFDDRAPDARGMAIKLMDVAGPKLLSDERATHDFILVDAPVFVARDPEHFVAFLVLSARVADARAKSDVAQASDLQRQLALEFPNAGRLRRVIRHPLFVPYFSQTPYALGSGRAVKYQAMPQRLETVAPTSTELDALADPHNYLADALDRTLDDEDVVFDFRVQVGNDRMPIDDPTIEWSASESPFVPVATVTIPRQKFTWAAQRRFAENIAFNPWHALEAHKPLGGINEARRDVYARMLERRHAENRVPTREPTGTNDF